MKGRELIIFLSFFLAGSFLRLWQLTKIPPGLHYDEASFAYNAYCLLKTGKDEFGSPMPANIRAFDDWRPPVYTYLTIASFLAFGVNDFAVRFPSSLSGILLILVFYFFVRDFIGQKIALLATFLLSINPTLIMFSRAAYDSNLSLFFTICCFWLFWKGVRKKKVIWFVGCLFFAVLSVLTYQASKVFVPLLLLVFVFVYWKEFVKILRVRRNFFILLFSTFFFITPVLLSFLAPKSLFRFTTISVFTQEKILKTSINRLLLNQKMGLSLFNPFANRRVLFFQEFFLRYLDNFSPSFLFAPKEPSMHYIPNFGSFPWFEIVFFLVGIFVIGRKLDKGKKIILASWFFLVALPTAPLYTAPYITRILPIIPLIILPISFGLSFFWQKFSLLIIGIYGFSFLYLLYSLFWLLPAENGKVWQVGYREMVEKAYQVKDKYEKIYVSNSLQRPYIFFLWYPKYNPVLYQPQGKKRGGSGLSPEVELENFSFRHFSPEIFEKKENNLYIGKPEDFPEKGQVLEEIGCGEEERQECFWFDS